MTKEEFIRQMDLYRIVILAFLSKMPADATATEMIQAINAESLDSAGLDQIYRAFVAFDISATQSRH